MSYFNDQVSREEFENPDMMSPHLIYGLAQTRRKLGLPMRFTLSRGHEVHPSGDACRPDSTSHAPKSLHKYGLPGQPFGLAQDLDFFFAYIRINFVVFEALIGMEFDDGSRWSGLGFYPNWNTKGFHLDRRPMGHFTLTQDQKQKIWICDKRGGYNFLPTLKDRISFMRDEWGIWPNQSE